VRGDSSATRSGERAVISSTAPGVVKGQPAAHSLPRSPRSAAVIIIHSEGSGTTRSLDFSSINANRVMSQSQLETPTTALPDSVSLWPFHTRYRLAALTHDARSHFRIKSVSPLQRPTRAQAGYEQRRPPQSHPLGRSGGVSMRVCGVR
jgi:hypothetical protein